MCRVEILKSGDRNIYIGVPPKQFKSYYSLDGQLYFFAPQFYFFAPYSCSSLVSERVLAY